MAPKDVNTKKVDASTENAIEDDIEGEFFAFWSSLCLRCGHGIKSGSNAIEIVHLIRAPVMFY